MPNNESLPNSAAEAREEKTANPEQNQKFGEEVLDHIATDAAAEQHAKNDESEQQLAEDDIDKRIQELMTADEIVENLPNLIEQGADVNGIIERLDPGQVAANLDTLIADKSKVDLDKLIEKLPPRVLMLNADKLKALDPSISEINRTIEEQLTPQEIAEQLDSLIEQGADVNLIIDKLDPWTIADNLPIFLQNKSKLDMNKLLDKLPDWVIALSLDRLKKAGASVNQQELFDKLNPDEIANELKDLIRAGADVSILISCLEPQAIVDNLDLLLTDKKNAATICSILEKTPGAIALNIKKLTDAGIRVREKQIMKQIPSAEIAKNIPELIEAGIDVKTIFNNLSPEDILENLDKFGDKQESIDFKTLFSRATSEQITAHIDAFIKHQIDIKDIFIKLDSAGIASNLEILLQNKVNINEIIINLSPEDLAAKLNDIIEAGGDINVILNGLDQKDAIKNLDTFLEQGNLNFALLAAKIGPRAVLNNLEKLLSAAKRAGVEVNIDQLTEDLNAEAIATNEDNLDRLIKAGADTTAIAIRLQSNPDLFKKEINRLLSYGAELDKIAEHIESWAIAETLIILGVEAKKVATKLEVGDLIEHADYLIANGAESKTILGRLSSDEVRDNLYTLLEANVDVDAIMDSLDSPSIVAKMNLLIEKGGADIHTVIEKLDTKTLAAFAILIYNKYKDEIDPYFIFEKLGADNSLPVSTIFAFRETLGDKIDINQAAKYLSPRAANLGLKQLVAAGVSSEVLLNIMDFDRLLDGRDDDDDSVYESLLSHSPGHHLPSVAIDKHFITGGLPSSLRRLIKEGGVDINKIFDKVKPAHAFDERLRFKHDGATIDIKELSTKLSPSEKAERILELNAEGAEIDVNQLVTELEPIDIAANIAKLIRAGAKINVNEVVSRLSPNQIAHYYEDLKDAGAEIDPNEILDKIDDNLNYFRFVDFLANALSSGADEEKVLAAGGSRLQSYSAAHLMDIVRKRKIEVSDSFLGKLVTLLNPSDFIKNYKLFADKIDANKIVNNWEPETIAKYYKRLTEINVTIDIVNLVKKLYEKDQNSGKYFVAKILSQKDIVDNYDALRAIIKDERILPTPQPVDAMAEQIIPQPEQKLPTYIPPIPLQPAESERKSPSFDLPEMPPNAPNVPWGPSTIPRMPTPPKMPVGPMTPPPFAPSNSDVSFNY